jgi:hypothetical protein
MTTAGMMAFVLAITPTRRLAFAQEPKAPAGEGLPVLRSTRPVVSVQEGSTLHRDAWRLAPEVSPDVYEAVVSDGASLTVTFLTDVDRICFAVEVGSQHDFIIQPPGHDSAAPSSGVRQRPLGRADHEPLLQAVLARPG